MVTVICSWCNYVGQGNSYEERIKDVTKHEDKCTERYDEKDGLKELRKIKRAKR